MPPVHLKLQEAPKITTLPDDSLDLFDNVTNVVTKSNSQIVYKRQNPNKNSNFHVVYVTKVSIKIRNQFTATTVVSGSTNLLRA